MMDLKYMVRKFKIHSKFIQTFTPGEPNEHFFEHFFFLYVKVSPLRISGLGERRKSRRMVNPIPVTSPVRRSRDWLFTYSTEKVLNSTVLIMYADMNSVMFSTNMNIRVNKS